MMNALVAIDGAQPLSLEIPADTSFEDWLEIGRRLKVMKDRAERRTTQINWWIGDWWAHGDHKYGGRSKLAADGVFGAKSFGHLSNIGSVARRFEASCRHEVLSFTHYQEAARLPEGHRDEIIQQAISDSLSVRDVRTEVIKRRVQIGGFVPAPYDGDAEYAEAVAIAQRWNRAGRGARETILDLLAEAGLVVRVDCADLSQEIDP